MVSDKPGMKTSLPKISVITPSLNQGDFIGQTIESVLSQGYPKLEYIVMDGGSTDNTLEVLKKCDDRVYWETENDRGQSHAINKGLRLASGDVVALLNSDDLHEPETLFKVGKFFAHHPKADWLTGKCRVIDQRGRTIRRGVTQYKNFWLRFRSYRVLLVLDYISQPATFWRYQVIKRIGEFDEDLQYAMDYDYSLRVGQHFQLWVLNEYLASYRMHPSSKAGGSAQAQFCVDLEIAKKYTSSSVIRVLHAFHNSLVVSIYRLLLHKKGFAYLLSSSY
jgi:glycosyltransferase involved in cell wall biosynthesis